MRCCPKLIPGACPSPSEIEGILWNWKPNSRARFWGSLFFFRVELRAGEGKRLGCPMGQVTLRVWQFLSDHFPSDHCKSSPACIFLSDLNSMNESLPAGKLCLTGDVLR